MKPWQRLILTVAGLLSAAAAAADTASAPQARGQGRQGDPERVAPLDRWMERLRGDDPAEHARLERLRREDREAFGHEMRQRARATRIRRALEPHPELQEAFSRLTPEEQEQVLQLLGRDRGPRARLPRKVTENVEQLRAAEETLAALREAYLQASDGEERERLSSALRIKLTHLYDRRTQVHQEILEQMEQHLEEVRQRLRERGGRRESWVQQRMETLTAPRAQAAGETP